MFMSWFASSVLTAASAANGTCTFKADTDVGDQSSIISHTRGTFTQQQCCDQCQANAACAVAALLDASTGNEGCWLKSGEGGTYAHKGTTACYSGRSPSPSPESVPLTLLRPAAAPLARCMDGSPGGYYHAANASSTKWVIDLQGGGECASKKNCDGRVGSALFSSKYFSARTTLGKLAQAGTANARLATWNRVFVPYCSQDLWTGQRAAASDETYGYFFAGHHILAAVFDALEAAGGLASATDIVLTGESAGGIGVWPNVDYLAGRYPAARVVAAPIAGFYFFADPYRGPGHTASGLADFREAAWPAHFDLWQSFVDEDCAAAIEPWRCVLANNSFPYVSSHAFVIEAQTDQVVLNAHDWVPQDDPNWTAPVLDYMAQWHDNMTVALAPSMDPASPNGVFNPACFIHTSFSASSPLLSGLNYLDAFANWYFGGAGAKTKLQDDCGILCNPTCNH